MTLDQLLVCLHILTNFSPKTKTQDLDSWFMFALYLWKNRYFVHWQPENGRQYYGSDAGTYSTEPGDFLQMEASTMVVMLVLTAQSLMTSCKWRPVLW